MDQEILTKNGYHPNEMKVACLKNYRLKIGMRATLIPEDHHETWGTIMSLSPSELNKLYSAPSVSDYRPVNVDCVLQNSSAIKTDVYILDPSDPLTPPNDDTYAKDLLKTCKKLELPLSYQQEIATIISKIEG